ncbi:MAG: hypothetical protein LBJ12_03860, partial [Oscillospiraceae bacterium]|nr:hypothetical protein [Oscillospiraceae bacterium]
MEIVSPEAAAGVQELFQNGMGAVDEVCPEQQQLLNHPKVIRYNHENRKINRKHKRNNRPAAELWES